MLKILPRAKKKILPKIPLPSLSLVPNYTKLMILCVQTWSLILISVYFWGDGSTGSTFIYVMLLQALVTWWLLLLCALISMSEESITLDHSICSKTDQALLTHPFIVCNHQASNQPTHVWKSLWK